VARGRGALASLEERVARLEAAERRRRLLGLARLAFYAILLAGLVVYLVGLYESSGEWRAELADTPRVGLRSPRVVGVEVPLRIYNPDGDVMAKLVYYRVYINGYYAGDGFMPYLHLPSGWSEHVVRLEVDLSRASCGLAQALASGGNATVRVEGYAMVDLKVFGRFTWKTVTLPFNLTATQVQLPQLDPATRGLLELYLYACNNSASILEVLQAAASLLSQGGLLPVSPIAPGGGGGGSPAAPINVTAAVEPQTPGGLPPYVLVVNVTNTGSEPVVVYEIHADSHTLEVNETIQPGTTRTYHIDGLLTPPEQVTVSTSSGTVVVVAVKVLG